MISEGIVSVGGVRMAGKDKVCVGVGIGAFVVFLIGFASPYWIMVSGGNSGLWQTCASGVCVDMVGLAGLEGLCPFFNALNTQEEIDRIMSFD